MSILPVASTPEALSVSIEALHDNCRPWSARAEWDHLKWNSLRMYLPLTLLSLKEHRITNNSLKLCLSLTLHFVNEHRITTVNARSYRLHESGCRTDEAH